MKILILILGIFFTGLGVYITAQAWHFAASEHRIEPISYIGPFIAVMGLYRIFRAAASMPPPRLFQFVALGVAALIGYGDQLAIKAVYPGATTVSLNTTR